MPDLCIVIVLYRESAVSSRTVKSLQNALSEKPELAQYLLICLYDNTPAAARPGPLPKEVGSAETLAFQPGVNAGLPAAYNQALAVAEERKIGWLLLLDSDTAVTARFLDACLLQSKQVDGSPHVVAIIPHVVEGSTVHSPRFASAMRRRTVPIHFSGIASAELVALNSGTVLRVSAVRGLGGFNGEFWLDYLDYWLFRTLHRRGLQVFVLGEMIEHSLSLENLGTSMSLARYQNMLHAEQYFTTKYGTACERVRLKLVLLSRAIRLAGNPLTRPFARLAASWLWKRHNTTAPPIPTESGL